MIKNSWLFKKHWFHKYEKTKSAAFSQFENVYKSEFT